MVVEAGLGLWTAAPKGLFWPLSSRMAKDYTNEHEVSLGSGGEGPTDFPIQDLIHPLPGGRLGLGSVVGLLGD